MFFNNSKPIRENNNQFYRKSSNQNISLLPSSSNVLSQRVHLSSSTPMTLDRTSTETFGNRYPSQKLYSSQMNNPINCFPSCNMSQVNSPNNLPCTSHSPFSHSPLASLSSPRNPILNTRDHTKVNQPSSIPFVFGFPSSQSQDASSTPIVLDLNAFKSIPVFEEAKPYDPNDHDFVDYNSTLNNIPKQSGNSSKTSDTNIRSLPSSDQLIKSISSASEEDQISREDLITLKQAFNLFDRNGDGKISSEELQHVLQSLRLISDQEMILLNQQFHSTVSGDGLTIDFYDFIHLLKSSPEVTCTNSPDCRIIRWDNTTTADEQSTLSESKRFESMPVRRVKPQKKNLNPLLRFKNFIFRGSSRDSAESSKKQTKETTEEEEFDIASPNKSQSYNNKEDMKRFGSIRKADPTTRLEELQSVFNVFDADRDGFISPDELRQVMNELGMNKVMQDSEVIELFRLVNRDIEGSLSFQDFLTLFSLCC